MLLKIAAAAAVMIVSSCGPSQRGLFAKKSAHEQYAGKLREAGLAETTMGRAWFKAAAASLTQPISVAVPFKETGYFPAEEPRAAGYVFNVSRGAEINILLTIKPQLAQTVFAELWKHDADTTKNRLLSAADSTLSLRYEVEKDGKYIFRFQPQLLQSCEYTLTITTAPSLAFPVSESGKPRLISFWSDPRDRGTRSHEGVDISAGFRTPAVAAADGVVHRVTDNRLGGKVVFMRPEGKSYSLYYAHLDTQTVIAGQRVKTGEVLGLVGNTGNARGTVPHLHFGIYAMGGAVDPLPFINPKEMIPAAITSSTNNINKWMRHSKTGDALKILAASAAQYKVLLPDDSIKFVSANNVTSTAIRILTTDTATHLMQDPTTYSPVKKTIAANTKIALLGNFGDFQLAEYENITGWIRTR